MAESIIVPVLPLRDVVVYPHMVIPLFVGRNKSIQALDMAMDSNKQILLVAQKSAEVDAPDFGIAPLGADVQDGKPQAAAPHVDLSQFSLAPPGSDMGEVKKAPAGPLPDISHLKLQD